VKSRDGQLQLRVGVNSGVGAFFGGVGVGVGVVFYQIRVELCGVAAGHTLVGVRVGVELIYVWSGVGVGVFQLRFPTPVSFMNFVREEDERKAIV
jgi:hypothetical protein